jgi:hypothetical protein
MERLSSFIIALVLVGIVVGGVGLFFAGINTSYGSAYNASELEGFNRLSELQANAESINETLQHFNPANPLDVIGGFLTGGYQVVKVTWGSFAAFMGIGNAANAQLSNIVGGDAFGFLTSGLFLIVFILFIFIVVAVLVGRDRL